MDQLRTGVDNTLKNLPPPPRHLVNVGWVVRMCCLQAFGLWFSQESEAFGDLQLRRVPHGQGAKIHCISPFPDLTIVSVRLKTALFVRECEKIRWEAAAQAKLGKSDFSPQTPAQFVIQRVKLDLFFIAEQVKSM